MPESLPQKPPKSRKKSFGLIVDYIGLFDNVAKSLHFDEVEVQKVITNIDEVKAELPRLMHCCLEYFSTVKDRRSADWESLLEAQQCLPTTKVKDQFGADFLGPKQWRGKRFRPIHA